MFVFSPDVPDEFAIAVLYITTQRGSPKRWDTIRTYWGKDCFKSEKWITGIIFDNELTHPFDSIGWWKTQIVGN
jgi:hypothetical protein